MTESDWSKKLWWWIPAAGFLLVLTVLALMGPKPQHVGKGTSYDASGRGFRAAYLLLDELGYPVVRSRRATTGRVRWLLFPQSDQKRAPRLADWVRGGGRRLLAADEPDFARDLGITLRADVR